MARTDITVAEQLKRAAEALEAARSVEENSAPAASPIVSLTPSPASSPAPAGSLSASLLRSDRALRYGSN